MRQKRKPVLFLLLVLLAGLLFPSGARAAAPRLSHAHLTMVRGGTKTLKMKHISTSAKVVWKSSNKNVVSVNAKGKVIARGKGKADVTAKVGRKTYTCRVKVTNGKISRSRATLTVGETLTLKVTGTGLKPKWKSGKKAVAAVSSNGVVTAGKAGTAVITATIQGKKYTCRVTVKKAAAPKVTYKNYRDPDGCFTMSIPSGWKVRVGLMGAYDQPVDLISYGIQAYDPANTDRCVYFCLNTVGLKSQAAKNFQVGYYGFVSNTAMQNLMKAMPVITGTSTKSFFEGMQSLYGMKNFSVTKNLGRAASGGDVLRASAVSGSTGRKVDGLFTACLTTSTNMTYDTVFGQGMVDTGYAMGWSIGMERAGAGEFEKWQPVLDHVLKSVKFTDKFRDDREKVWENVMGTASYQQARGSEISEMIMSAWEKMK